MALSLKTSIALIVCDALVAQAGVGSTNPAARFSVYSGTPPANVEAALSGNTALITIDMANPAFKAAVDNPTDNCAEAEANTIAEQPAVADGTATFYRLFDRSGTAIWQGTVSEPNLGGDMEVSSLNVIAGVSVVVQSFFIRVPK